MGVYKVINEPTVIDPKERITDKRKSGPSFSDIRTILMHSRRKKVEISPEKIRETKKRLPQYTMELLQRCFAFIEGLVELKE